MLIHIKQRGFPLHIVSVSRSASNGMAFGILLYYLKVSERNTMNLYLRFRSGRYLNSLAYLDFKYIFGSAVKIA
jgi:hypothetical protein